MIKGIFESEKLWVPLTLKNDKCHDKKIKISFYRLIGAD